MPVEIARLFTKAQLISTAATACGATRIGVEAIGDITAGSVFSVLSILKTRIDNKAASDDSRFSDTRTPTDGTVTHAKAPADVGFLVMSETAPVSPVSKPGIHWFQPSTNKTFINTGSLATPSWGLMNAPQVFAFSKSAAPSPIGKIPLRFLCKQNIRITNFYFTLDDPITGGTLTLDLDRATAAAPQTMTSLYTTNTKPTTSSTTAYQATGALPNTVDIPAGDFLQARIASAPTGGANLAVFFEFQVRS